MRNEAQCLSFGFKTVIAVSAKMPKNSPSTDQPKTLRLFSEAIMPERVAKIAATSSDVANMFPSIAKSFSVVRDEGDDRCTTRRIVGLWSDFCETSPVNSAFESLV
jgi:hypothetical protein